MSSGHGFSAVAPIISDWHVDDWMERMQRMIPAKKPYFGNSPEGGNPVTYGFYGLPFARE
jgi:hypothetical protein